VWGPPGTGKTRLLQAAVSDLITDGKRVLLVSGTNIAVDNALLGVARERRHQPGQIVRVGPRQLREIADDPQISLPLMVRARLAEVEDQRRAAAMDLLEMDRREEHLRGAERQLAGFDAAAYEAAAELLTGPGSTLAEVTVAVQGPSRMFNTPRDPDSPRCYRVSIQGAGCSTATAETAVR
jgi:hypothetical protein